MTAKRYRCLRLRVTGIWTGFEPEPINAADPPSAWLTLGESGMAVHYVSEEDEESGDDE